jgi:hypothetical protein
MPRLLLGGVYAWPAVVMSRASETLPPIFTPAAHTRRLGFS